MTPIDKSYQYFLSKKDELLTEADKFIAGLDPKAARKMFYYIDLALNKAMTHEFSKNCEMTFGSLEQNLADNKSDCWHFGIKKRKLKH